MLKSSRPFTLLAGVPLLAVLSCFSEEADSPTAPAEGELATTAVVGSPKIAFVSSRGLTGDQSHIYTMYPDGSGLRRVTGDLCSPGAFCSNVQPTWSPDGGRIAFSSYRGGNYEIYAMYRTGSNKRNLTNYPGAERSPAWAPNGGRIAFSRDNEEPDPGDTEIWTVRPDGTGKKNITNDLSADFERSPAWSLDSRKIAWRREQGSVYADVAVKNADGTGETAILPHSWHEGYPQPQWSPARMHVAYESGDFDFMNIYVSNASGSNWLQVTTAALCPGSQFCRCHTPRWSPDGRKIAFVVSSDTETDIYVMGWQGTDIKRLTTAPGADAGPTWSPDGEKIAFVSTRDGNSEIYVMNVDGTRQRNVTNNPAQDGSPTWSR
jgi:Tol biopolymer transport system component